MILMIFLNRKSMNISNTVILKFIDDGCIKLLVSGSLICCHLGLLSHGFVSLIIFKCISKMLHKNVRIIWGHGWYPLQKICLCSWKMFGPVVLAILDYHNPFTDCKDSKQVEFLGRLWLSHHYFSGLVYSSPNSKATAFTSHSTIWCVLNSSFALRHPWVCWRPCSAFHPCFQIGRCLWGKTSLMSGSASWLFFIVLCSTV